MTAIANVAITLRRDELFQVIINCQNPVAKGSKAQRYELERGLVGHAALLWARLDGARRLL